MSEPELKILIESHDFNSLIIARSTVGNEMKKCLLVITSCTIDLHSRIIAIDLPASRSSLKLILSRIIDELEHYQLLEIQLNLINDAIALCRALMAKSSYKNHETNAA